MIQILAFVRRLGRKVKLEMIEDSGHSTEFDHPPRPFTKHMALFQMTYSKRLFWRNNQVRVLAWMNEIGIDSPLVTWKAVLICH